MKDKLNINKEAIKEKAVLVGVITQNQDEAQLKEYLDELFFLDETAGAIEVNRFSQKAPHPGRKTFVGKGKLEETLKFKKGVIFYIIAFVFILWAGLIKPTLLGAGMY